MTPPLSWMQFSSNSPIVEKNKFLITEKVLNPSYLKNIMIYIYTNIYFSVHIKADMILLQDWNLNWPRKLDKSVNDNLLISFNKNSITGINNWQLDLSTIDFCGRRLSHGPSRDSNPHYHWARPAFHRILRWWNYHRKNI